MWVREELQTCGICVVFPLPVSPTTTQLLAAFSSFSSFPLAGKMGRARRQDCKSSIAHIPIILSLHRYTCTCIVGSPRPGTSGLRRCSTCTLPAGRARARAVYYKTYVGVVVAVIASLLLFSFLSISSRIRRQCRQPAAMPLNLGDTFPDFKVDTTSGEIQFHEYLGTRSERLAGWLAAAWFSSHKSCQCPP